MSSLNPSAEYEELTSVRLVGVMLTIIVRKDIRHKIQGFSSHTVATGTFNVLVSLWPLIFALS